MRAFHIYLPLSAAGLCSSDQRGDDLPAVARQLRAVQIAIAFPLTNYGVDYAHGVAFGIGLQAIEASVGVGVGLIFLAREGLSYAMLRNLQDEEEQRVPEKDDERERERARAGVSG
jgi:hypothetical protein